MQLWVGVVIFILLLAAFWSAYHYWSTGELPDSFLQRQYAKVKEYRKPKKAIQLYNETIGHNFDQTAQTALKNGERDEKLFAEQINSGVISNANLAAAITNSYALSNIYTHFMPQTPQNIAAANAHREETVRRITLNPAAAIQGEIAPERIIAEWADAPFQMAIFADLQTARARDAPRQSRYFMRPIAADSQNVHDSSVQNDTLRVLRQMQSKNAHEFPPSPATPIRSIAELQEYIAQQPVDKAAAATRVLATMQLGSENTSLGINEHDLLVEAWTRTNSAENANRQSELRAAIFEALVDSATPSGTVCLTGRCNRVIGAFTLLDADESIAQPAKTIDILRSEILQRSSKILNDHLESSQLKAAYESGETTPEITTLIDVVKTDIHNMQSDYQSHKPEIVNQCITDAIAGL